MRAPAHASDAVERDKPNAHVASTEKSRAPLRVLLSSYACQPGEASEAGIGWSWAFELAKAGAEVWVLTLPKGKDAIERSLFENPDLDLHFVYIQHPPLGQAMRDITRGGHSWNHFLGYLEWQDRAYRIAIKLRQDVEFDIVHHVSLSSLHIGSRLWKLNLPFVFGPVGGAQTTPAGFGKYLRGKRLFERVRTIVARYLYAYVLNARSTVRGSRLVLVTNRDTQEAVLRLGAREVRLMTDIGVAADRVASHPPISRSAYEPLRILWVARLEPRKALLLALEAVAKISSQVFWKLTIIGDGPQGPMVPEWIAELGLADRVEWRGRIPWAEVQEAYDESDLFLFTSLRDTTGIQLLEAMGRGVPIVTLDHQGASFVVPDCAGIKVPVTTPIETAMSVARAIEQLAVDREKLYTMGEAAIEVARRNTWERKAQVGLAIYRTLLES